LTTVPLAMTSSGVWDIFVLLGDEAGRGSWWGRLD
jgi:hypothetical protein